MTPDQSFTLIVSSVGIAGALAGIVISSLFQSHGQHKQWRRDNVRQECKELLGQLSVNRFAIIDWRKSIASRNDDKMAIFAALYSDAVLDLHRNFHSRILIANELKKANIPNRWEAILNSFDGDLPKLNAECDQLTEEIVQIGRKV